MIYLDHAASSFPKPTCTIEAVARCLNETGANPGRSGHRLSADAARIIFDTREAAAALLNVSDSRQVLLLSGATHALNLAIFGLLKKNDHVVVTAMQHNSVSRPIKAAEQTLSLRISEVLADAEGRISPADVRRAIQPDTSLVVANHASNVTGIAQPIGEIKEAARKVPLLVDAAQSAGVLPIDTADAGIDMLAFSGHKSLLGPQGTGGLYVRPGLALRPLIHGGTGSRSESDRQPEFLPDALEAGTPNTPGIAGLGAGIKFVLENSVATIHAHAMKLFHTFMERARRIPGISFYGDDIAGPRTATVSLNLKNRSPSETARLLERHHGILCRAGLHCAPSAHRVIGTFPHGTVRISIGFSNTEDEMHAASDALMQIATS